MSKRRVRPLPAAIGMALALASASAAAQTAAAPAEGETPPARRQTPAQLDTVVVTANPGSGLRRKVETSYAISTVDQDRLQMQAPSSVTDALRMVPGFWVEGSAGEASGNVRTRGIPTDGYSSVGLQEDGITLQHDAGLGWLNADQSFRMDETIERVEVVRGGPSSIFASNSPGALINFITRKGSEIPEGAMKLQASDYGMQRVDAWYGGMVGDWRLMAGGFFRSSPGTRDPGWDADRGGQLRFTALREFDDGSEFEFGIRHMDDHVGFTPPFPLMLDASGDVAGVPGFDPHEGVAVGPETRRVRLQRNGQPYDIDMEEGTHVRVTQLTGRYERDLGGWRLRNIARYRDSDTLRNGFFPYAVQSADEVLALAGGGPGLDLRYADGTIFDPAGQNGTGLTMVNLARSFQVPESEFVNDLRLTRGFDTASGRHDLTFGAYYAHVNEEFNSYSGLVATELRDHARLLDIYLTGADGSLTKLTEGGVLQSGTEWVDGIGTSDTWAVYAADEWTINPQWRLDAGLRYERIAIDGTGDRQTDTPLGFDRRFDDLAWTAGANWQFQRNMGLFARYTSTFRLPSLGDFIGIPDNEPVTQEMRMAELGFKSAGRWGEFYATLFRSEYDSYAVGDAYQDPDSGRIVSRVVYGDTRTNGLELEGIVRPAAWFDLRATATLQDAEFGRFAYNENVGGELVQRDYSGNRLLRVPETSYRLTPGFNFMQGRLRVELDVERYGDRYADVANQQRLPAYTVLNANLVFDINDRMTLNLHGGNLTDELGLTQGNPRQSQIDAPEAADQVFIARPIQPRNWRAALTWRF